VSADPNETAPAVETPSSSGAASARDALDAALARARGAARRRGTPAAGGKAGRGRKGSDHPRRRDRGFSGSGPDDRDPQRLGRLVDRISSERGWAPAIAEGSIAGRWPELVGEDVAAHCRPQRLEGGDLHLVAESTAWATQLRLLAPELLRRLGRTLGNDVVRRVHVHGPATPDWRRGPWRVSGRGPRDTYG
jgi:predicted nucleic acid-binding Zn ribbon protein